MRQQKTIRRTDVDLSEKNATILLRQLSEKSDKSVSLIFFAEIITNICLYDNSSNSRYIFIRGGRYEAKNYPYKFVFPDENVYFCKGIK